MFNPPRRRQFTQGPPTITYMGTGANVAFIGTTQTIYRSLTTLGGLITPTLAVGQVDESRLIIGACNNVNGAVPQAAWICGVPAVIVSSVGAAPNCYIFCAPIPFDVQLPSFTANVRWATSPSGNPAVQFFSALGLASHTPRSVASFAAATGTDATVDLNTEADGIYVAIAGNNTTAAQSTTWTGDDSPSEAQDSIGSGWFSTAIKQGTSADSANTITATFAAAATTAIGITAAAWR
jgi:hypothetical protein